jgi:hypothetical protein
MYCSCYICHNLFLFCSGYHGNYFEHKHIHLGTILKVLNIFCLYDNLEKKSIFNITTKFGVYGVDSTMCQKFAKTLKAARAWVLLLSNLHQTIRFISLRHNVVCILLCKWPDEYRTWTPPTTSHACIIEHAGGKEVRHSPDSVKLERTLI